MGNVGEIAGKITKESDLIGNNYIQYNLVYLMAQRTTLLI